MHVYVGLMKVNIEHFVPMQLVWGFLKVIESILSSNESLEEKSKWMISSRSYYHILLICRRSRFFEVVRFISSSRFFEVNPVISSSDESFEDKPKWMVSRRLSLAYEYCVCILYFLRFSPMYVCVYVCIYICVRICVWPCINHMIGFIL